MKKPSGELKMIIGILTLCILLMLASIYIREVYNIGTSSDIVHAAQNLNRSAFEHDGINYSILSVCIEGKEFAVVGASWRREISISMAPIFDGNGSSESLWQRNCK